MRHRHNVVLNTHKISSMKNFVQAGSFPPVAKQFVFPAGAPQAFTGRPEQLEKQPGRGPTVSSLISAIPEKK